MSYFRRSVTIVVMGWLQSEMMCLLNKTKVVLMLNIDKLQKICN